MRFIEVVKGFLGDFRQGLGERWWRNATPCHNEGWSVVMPIT